MDSSKKRGVWWRRIMIAGLSIAVVGLLVPVRVTTAQDARPNRAQANGEQSLAEGRQNFEGRCVGCHGLDGRGGERAPDIATRPAIQQYTDAKLFQIIKSGNPTAGMPAFPSLDDGTVNALIAYVRFLQGKGPATKIPGDPRNGEALFFGKARCSQCHVLNGKGGFIASDLSRFGHGRSVAEIREAIVKPQDTRANMVVLVTTRGGEKLTGVPRNEDNFSLQLQSLDGSFHLLTRREIESVTPQQGSLMPADYGSTLSAQELDDLIGFLMTAANKEHGPAAQKETREDEDE